MDVDGEKYDIRLWAFLPDCGGFERYGMQGECAVYALSEKNEFDKGYTEQVDDDFIRIERGNRAAYEVPQGRLFSRKIKALYDRAVSPTPIMRNTHI